MNKLELQKGLKKAEVKHRRAANGLLYFYIRTGKPQYMDDGSFWKGTEGIGYYRDWDHALTCGYLKSYIEK